MKITHNGKDYELNVEEALKQKVLTPFHHLEVGDVFVPRAERNYTNPFLLVSVKWGSDDSTGKRFQLLGIGCATNSNNFFEDIHTLDEISEYLQKNDMVFSHNINKQVWYLVQGKPV